MEAVVVVHRQSRRVVKTLFLPCHHTNTHQHTHKHRKRDVGKGKKKTQRRLYGKQALKHMHSLFPFCFSTLSPPPVMTCGTPPCPPTIVIILFIVYDPLSGNRHQICLYIYIYICICSQLHFMHQWLWVSESVCFLCFVGLLCFLVGKAFHLIPLLLFVGSTLPAMCSVFHVFFIMKTQEHPLAVWRYICT